MSLCSDVDILFLHRGRADADGGGHRRSASSTGSGTRGVTLGGATRSVEESIELGRRDADRRDLAAHRALPGRRARAAPRARRRGAPRAAAGRGRLRRRPARRARSSATRSTASRCYLLQPNLKEGAGGLRDYHAALWVACAVFPPVRGLDDLLHVGLLSENEMEGFRARARLPLADPQRAPPARRPQGRPARLRAPGARWPRASATPTTAPRSPVERFMGEYYRHARAIRTLSEIVLEQCAARSRPPAPPPPAAAHRGRLPRGRRPARDPPRRAPARAAAAPAHGLPRRPAAPA